MLCCANISKQSALYAEARASRARPERPRSGTFHAGVGAAGNERLACWGGSVCTRRTSLSVHCSPFSSSLVTTPPAGLRFGRSACQNARDSNRLPCPDFPSERAFDCAALDRPLRRLGAAVATAVRRRISSLLDQWDSDRRRWHAALRQREKVPCVCSGPCFRRRAGRHSRTSS